MALILSGSNGVSDVDGSAATPAVRGSDTNTGIFFPGEDRIGFSEGGVQVGEFDANGNLLVGATTNTNSSRIVANGVIESTSGGVRFPDGSTQNTAAGAVSTALDGVGSYAIVTIAINTNFAIGATIAGSNLRYNNRLDSMAIIGNPFRDGTERAGAGYTVYNGGGTALSGTWRKLNDGNNFFIDTYTGTCRWGRALLVRIS